MAGPCGAVPQRAIVCGILLEGAGRHDPRAIERTDRISSRPSPGPRACTARRLAARSSEAAAARPGPRGPVHRHYSRRTREACVAWIRRYIGSTASAILTNWTGRGHTVPDQPRPPRPRGGLHTEPGAERAPLPLPRCRRRGASVARRHRAREAHRAFPRRAHASEVRAVLQRLDGVPRLMAACSTRPRFVGWGMGALAW
jgi:hypothetical protein